MSNTREQKYTLPIDLPKCDCFSGGGEEFAMHRCSDIARACCTLAVAFKDLSEQIDLCKEALPYFAELLVVSLLTNIAKTQGPALEYGTEDIEREVERMLLGLEARVLMRSRDVYARSREAGLTEASVLAYREREERGGGLS